MLVKCGILLFMTRQISGLDSLVYSEGVLEEEENLLQDSTELM